VSENSNQVRKRSLPGMVSLLSIIGALLSAYALYHHTKLHVAEVLGVKLAPSFCNISDAFNCDAVNTSAYAVFLGVPLAAWGLTFYLSLFLLSIIARNRDRFSARSSGNSFLVVSTLSLFFSIYLFYISKFKIGNYCLLCMGLYALSILLFLACFFVKSEEAGFFSRWVSGMRSMLQVPLL